MEDCLLSAAELGPSPNPDPPSISGESWTLAEETTVEVLNCIHPTLDSEEKRKDVIDYLQRLIRNSIGCEVFAYGSVPLKTYLPDGDIDLTGFRSNSLEENLARDVLGILLREEQNQNAEFQVKDTQFIDAEVKLVKCLIQNMVIDISFNQLGGICTLCFLEQVDRLIGKDHLLKRSIILIKAWCYYESRILGANHGLISTYALETLVLYIFHLFSSSLNGPLAVLHRFLDYFSKFDWENYCISLHGPVRKASLPDLVVEAPENGGDFIFGKENLRNCVEIFSLPSLDTSSTPFPLKHLNIIDPLRENNNLGRSVHKGNYYRICSAFKYGARKLGQILRLPKEELGDEIKSFFSNTLDRHGPKVDNFVLPSALEFSRTFSMSSRGEKLNDYLRLKSLNLEIDDDNPDLSDESCVLRHRLDEDANDLSTSRGRSGNETLDCSSISELGNSGENFCSSFKYLDFREMGLLVISGNDENLNPLSDLCGDYHGHLRSLLYGKSCHGFPFSAPMLRSMPLPLPPLNRNLCSQMKMNGVPLPFCPVFGLKEHLKTRGTGTYFPKTNWCSCIEKSPKWRGRNSANQSKLQGKSRKNGITHAALPAKSSSGEGTLKPIKGHEKSVFPMKSHQSNSVGTHVNGFSNSSLRIEFGSFGKR